MGESGENEEMSIRQLTDPMTNIKPMNRVDTLVKQPFGHWNLELGLAFVI